EHPEAAPAEPRTLLKEEGRARRIEANCNDDREQYRGEKRQLDAADNYSDHALGYQRTRLENRATKLEEGLIVVRYKCRPQPIDPDCSRREQDLTTRVQALLDQIVDSTRRQIGADDDCL